MIKHRDELNLISFEEKNRLFGIFRERDDERISALLKVEDARKEAQTKE